MAKHLALCHRKAFALQWAVQVALQDAGEAVETHPTWAKVRSELDIDLKAHLPPARTDDVPLDAFLQQTVAAAIGTRTIEAHPAVLPRLDAHAAAISCAACAAAAGRDPCRGDEDHDDGVVDAAGWCIRPLRETFHQTLDLAAGIYRRAAGLTGIGAELVTTYGVPGPLAGRTLALTGQVFWTDRGATRGSEVQLVVAPQLLDRLALEMLPYTLMHEVVCHVFQFAGGGPRRGEPDEYCAFAEGWMDFVAAGLVAGGVLPGGGSPWPDAAAEAAWLIHRNRRARPFPGAPQVAIGARAAERVLRLFVDHDADAGLPRSAWDDFVDLSCQLNASPAWTQTLRRRVLPTLPARLGAADRGRLDQRLIDALLKWRPDHATDTAGALPPVIAELGRTG